jgi:hypothetical protein
MAHSPQLAWRDRGCPTPVHPAGEVLILVCGTGHWSRTSILQWLDNHGSESRWCISAVPKAYAFRRATKPRACGMCIASSTAAWVAAGLQPSTLGPCTAPARAAPGVMRPETLVHPPGRGRGRQSRRPAMSLPLNSLRESTTLYGHASAVDRLLSPSSLSALKTRWPEVAGLSSSSGIWWTGTLWAVASTTGPLATVHE